MTRSTMTSSPRARGTWLGKLVVVCAAMAMPMIVNGQPSPATNGTITLGACDASSVFRTFAAAPGETVDPNNADPKKQAKYKVDGSSGSVFFDISNESNCNGSNPSLTCLTDNTLVVTAPQAADPNDPVPADTSFVTFSRTPAFVMADIGKNARWITVGADASSGTDCTQHYRFHVTNSSGGWGDPHLTTVDGVHYDFQSAGEFTALKQEGLEIQTRQSAVPTATVPITNPYTDITHCVAIYTAVAAKFGQSRVTIQPGLASGEVNREHMQLRVNGKLTTLTAAGVVLGTPGTGGMMGTFDGLIKPAEGGAIEITDASGTQLVVTPAFWSSQSVWYLNVNVYQTSATLGTMGKIANGEGSWLPALPDGSSLGSKPESESERYEVLYEKFADAWRVTDSSSLFDYATGEGTAMFTLDEWPRNHPQSCAIQGQTPVQGTTPQVATQACAAVIDPVQRVDCEFDVAITGNIGFGKSYEVMQSFKPRGTGFVGLADPRADVGSGDHHGNDWETFFKKWWWLILLLVLLVILIKLLRK